MFYLNITINKNVWKTKKGKKKEKEKKQQEFPSWVDIWQLQVVASSLDVRSTRVKQSVQLHAGNRIGLMAKLQ